MWNNNNKKATFILYLTRGECENFLKLLEKIAFDYKKLASSEKILSPKFHRM